MKRFILAILVALLVVPFGFADNNEVPFNVQRASEEIEKGNYKDAEDYLNAEISANPKGCDAYVWMCYLKMCKEEYGAALSAGRKALEYAGKKDKATSSYIYRNMSNIYLQMTDTVAALDCIGKSIEAWVCEDNLLSRASIYLGLERYDEAELDYKRMLELNPESSHALVGLSLTAVQRKDFDKALSLCNKVLSLYPEAAISYYARANAYFAKGDYNLAVDDIISCLSIEHLGGAAAYLYYLFPETTHNLIVAKLKGRAVRNPNDSRWYIYLGNCTSEWGDHYQAALWCEKAFEIDADNTSPRHIALEYQKAGYNTEAYDWIDRAINMSSDPIRLLLPKGEILFELGCTDEALATYTNYLEYNPDSYLGYAERAMIYYGSRDWNKAIEDYSMAIAFEPTLAYLYKQRADCYMYINDKAKAEADYHKVLELDTVSDDNSVAMYAYARLGQRDKAIDLLNKYIARDTTYYGAYYDAACLYSRLGEKEKSLDDLEKSFKLGRNKYYATISDPDLDNVRQSEEFKALIDRYFVADFCEEDYDSIMVDSVAIVEEAAVEYMDTLAVDTIVDYFRPYKLRRLEKVVKPTAFGATDFDFNSNQPDRVEVPFTKNYGGTTTVKCEINGLPLAFCFDTGAATVTISQTEANFMLKNGYLGKNDIIGNNYYSTADGSLSVGTDIILRKINFQGLDLSNVRATVIQNQQAPLLLGQSVLGRLGRIEIDNTKQKLIITK